MQTEILESFGRWLDGYLDFERKPEKGVFWLDTMEFLCGRLNHPEIFAPCVHVAGSKGKGSVSAMVASILDAAGLKTGLYTSPHISHFSERVSLAHTPLPEGAYLRAAGDLRGLVESVPADAMPGGRPVTWFELMTAFAMLSFRNAGVNASVFEVGLGGRLDATNVVTPRVSVITPIELEHTEFLGDTLAQIAREKGGIIKRNVPVVSAAQDAEARSALEEIASGRGAPIRFADDQIDLAGIRRSYSDGFMSVEIKGKAFPRPLRARMRLLGRLQAENAALAALAVRAAEPRLAARAIEVGLSAAFLPARFEVVGAEKAGVPVVLDGAHTVRSVRATVETFREFFGGTDAVLLFACAADKDVRSIAPEFAGFGGVFLTRPGETKKSDLGEAQMAFSLAGIQFEAERDCGKALAAALEAARRRKVPLLVTGSFYLVAEVRRALGI